MTVVPFRSRAEIRLARRKVLVAELEAAQQESDAHWDDPKFEKIRAVMRKIEDDMWRKD